MECALHTAVSQSVPAVDGQSNRQPFLGQVSEQATDLTAPPQRESESEREGGSSCAGRCSDQIFRPNQGLQSPADCRRPVQRASGSAALSSIPWVPCRPYHGSATSLSIPWVPCRPYPGSASLSSVPWVHHRLVVRTLGPPLAERLLLSPLLWLGPQVKR